MAPIIGYWDIRSLIEPIRLTLTKAGQEYQLKSYKCGPAPNFDKSEWFNEKMTLGLDFPNIPYYIDGDVKITQYLAILRYLGRKHDLGPKTEDEHIRSDMVEQAAHEILMTCFRAWYSKSDEAYEEAKAGLAEYLPSKIEQIAKFLGDRKYFLGDRLSYVDFLLYSVLDYIRIYQASLIESHQVLKDFLDRIEALPEIEKYLKSDSFKRTPINNKAAKFANE